MPNVPRFVIRAILDVLLSEWLGHRIYGIPADLVPHVALDD